ncbi:MAG: alpha/beta fold hydrolase [Bacteroidales bacterium]|nr:alpha/beta fold hydrolase [Bacteroidales bacterium]
MYYQEVSFTNEEDSIKLAGMLFVPEGTDPFPVAVIIHGSGTSRRNNPWYLSVADHLKKNGVAVLLPDKRGSEKSTGNWIGADFETLATDTKSAIDFIMNQDLFSYSNVGIIGMSQGGWIAPIVANKSKNISFVVNMVGPMVTVDEQLLHEEFHNLSPYTYDFIARLIAPFAVEILKKLEAITPFVGFDPIPYWEEVKIPVFVAYGENDTNCPVEESLNRMIKYKLDHFQTKVYTDGGHAIVDKKTSRVSEQFLNDLVNFIINSVENNALYSS